MGYRKAFLCLAYFLLSTSLFAQGTKYHLLIGTYTSPGKSEGIYLYEFDSANGSLTYKSRTVTDNPSYFALSSDKKFLYSVSEGQSSKISAYSFDTTTGALKFINSQPSGSAGPTHISVDKQRKYVFAANYGGGSITALPVEKDGSLGKDIQDIKHEGMSIARKKPFVHSAVVSPDNKYVMAADLGTDKVNIYKFDPQKRPNALSKAIQPFVLLDPGSGPRHSTFHPSGRFFYVVTEINSNVYTFGYKNGTLTKLQSVSLVPDGHTGPSHGADVQVSEDGKFLYASTRSTLNEISIFSIDQKTGTLTLIGKQASQGRSSRTFAIDPTGNWLLSTGQASNEIVVFKRDKQSGLISATGQKLQIDKPSFLKFVSKD